MKKAKFGEGVIAQEADRSEVVSEDGSSVTLAFIKMFENGQIGLLWMPHLFADSSPVKMPDMLRAKLVELLRYHADRLEDRSMDARMKELMGNAAGGEA